jgi:AcrR family transcriptional regulator
VLVGGRFGAAVSILPVADRSPAPTGPTRPRRSRQAQERSRDTRRKLIRAAVTLWKERGFDEAFKTTTAEEIARAAGVSKGTFYFHFAHKEDILQEMAWTTVSVMLEEIDAGIRRGTPTFELVEQIMGSMARRASHVPRPAVYSMVGEWWRLNRAAIAGPHGVGVGFETVVRYGQDRGELPGDLGDVDELAALLHAATLDALVRWASTAQTATTLREALCRRADIILRGAAVSYGA